MSSPTISVIVPVYNVAALLPRCIDSLLAQNFADYEVLLVDDWFVIFIPICLYCLCIFILPANSERCSNGIICGRLSIR